MHGIARVIVKGYGERRISELSRRREFVPAQPDGGAKARAFARQFARDMAEAGLGGAIVPGPNPDGPMH